MTAQLRTGTLLGTTVYGDSCRTKKHAVYPSEIVPSIIFFFSAIIPQHRKVILLFHAYKRAKQTRNIIQLRNNILISPSMTRCEKESKF
jgi:hypothetical protein